jgi:hypothetical protein
MRRVTLVGDGDAPRAMIRMGGGLSVCVDYKSHRQAICPVLGLAIKNNYGQPVFGINNRLVPGYQFNDPSREGSITCHFRGLPLMPDTYSIDLFLGDLYQDHDVVYDAITFEVVAADVFGNGKLPGAECGPIYWPASWTHAPAEQETVVGSGRR